MNTPQPNTAFYIEDTKTANERVNGFLEQIAKLDTANRKVADATAKLLGVYGSAIREALTPGFLHGTETYDSVAAALAERNTIRDECIAAGERAGLLR